MENHSYEQIVGSPDAPYINRLAARCGLATNYHAVGHPSLPNYIAATSGSTQGIADDEPPSFHRLDTASIFGQVNGGSYEQSMPSSCAQGDAYPYAVKHDPQAYYRSERALCVRADVPYFRAAALRRFTFVTPNLCDDMHDCSVATGDHWLSQFVPRILVSAGYRSGATVVFITWDEDDGSNHVATLVLSAWTSPGTRSRADFTHYSLLRTTENLLGVRPLGDAASAPSMESAFRLP